MVKFCNKYREHDKNLMDLFFFDRCPDVEVDDVEN
jgi:hypothetical protein